MKTEQPLVRTSNASAVRSLKGDDNNLVRALSVLVLLATAGTGSVVGASAERLSAVSATASADDGNVPANALDGSLATRWSASGDGQWILFDLGSPKNIGSIKIAWYKGDVRSSRFDIQTSDSGTSWATVFTGQSSGTQTSLEDYDVTDSSGQYVRIVGHGTSRDLWNSIAEAEFYAPSASTGSLASNGPALKISRTTGSPSGPVIALNWSAVAGAISQVQVSSNLVTWANIGVAITNGASAQTWQETLSNVPGSATPARFYRVKQNAASKPTQISGLPSELLDLTNWKLTLPVDTSHAGSPDEITRPELDGFSDPSYFALNTAGNGVVFTAPCGGATTSGSGYPRSELREMTANGKANASWSTTSGTHTMEITQAVTHLPVAKPHVVAGQIHNAADDVIVFRLEDSKLFIDQNGVNGPVLTTNYKLGDVFSAKFVARNGGVECYYNGQYIYTYKISASGCYFKAGCYTQSNTSRGDASTAYGEVILYGLSVTHQ